ncbi:hypothetical protein EIJ81_00970 (plasmid) [Aliivibrio salmonicida]|uniref:hypothetical protein n=1 Tax=Aliivibrio salmonicida TaxID=40269 RepID=UPI000F70243E|nr:hypothetical protein [Aliivibrio salmonicida]AZL83472.1 hypothetical protein EIJ81_00970 [Aliivibrio salmonicida]
MNSQMIANDIKNILDRIRSGLDITSTVYDAGLSRISQDFELIDKLYKLNLFIDDELPSLLQMPLNDKKYLYGRCVEAVRPIAASKVNAYLM